MQEPGLAGEGGEGKGNAGGSLPVSKAWRVSSVFDFYSVFRGDEITRLQVMLKVRVRK